MAQEVRVRSLNWLRRTHYHWRDLCEGWRTPPRGWWDIFLREGDSQVVIELRYLRKWRKRSFFKDIVNHFFLQKLRRRRLLLLQLFQQRLHDCNDVFVWTRSLHLLWWGRRRGSRWRMRRKRGVILLVVGPERRKRSSALGGRAVPRRGLDEGPLWCSIPRVSWVKEDVLGPISCERGYVVEGVWLKEQGQKGSSGKEKPSLLGMRKLTL